MTFLQPGILIAGVAGILIPIIIHWFFRQRRHPVEWGAMRFLLEAFQRARRRLRMEQWLLLLIRSVLIGLFALALGRLLLSAGIGGAGASLLGNRGGGRVIYLLIDNGITAGVSHDANTPHTALSQHKKKAEQILKVLHTSDRVALLTLARPTATLIEPPALDHRAIREILNEIELTEATTEYASAFERLRESIAALPDNGAPVLVYLFSDFYQGAAKTGSTMPEFLRGFNRPVSLYASTPAAEPIDNIQITAIEPARSLLLKQVADGSGQVRVFLRRVGALISARGSPSLTTLRLATTSGSSTADWEDDGKVVSIIRWAPGQVEASTEFSVPVETLSSGTVGLRVSIGNDALAADNTRFATVEIREFLRVGVVDRREYRVRTDLQNLSAGAWFQRALNPGAGSKILVEEVDPAVIEPATLHHLDALFVCQPDLVTERGWEAIADFVAGGGLLWLVPAVEQSVALWTDQARDALNLPWVWARAVVELTVDANGIKNPESIFLAENQPDSTLLRRLRSEQHQLVQPISITKYLPIIDGVQPGHTALRLRPDEVIKSDNVKIDSINLNSTAAAWLVYHSSPDGGGLIVYLASPPHLSWTSLPAKPLMVALVQETLRQGLSLGYSRRKLLPGDQPRLRVPATATALRRVTNDENTAVFELPFLPDGVMAQTLKPFTKSGLYVAIDRQGMGTDLFAVNIAPTTAVVKTQPATDVLTWLRRSGEWTWVTEDDLLAGIQAETARAEVSQILLVMVLILAISETVLARRFSHAYRSTREQQVRTSVQILTGTLESAETSSQTATKRGILK